MSASVVIVSYNSAHRLRACLDALRDVFDFTLDQVIVVDNHSSDDSVAVAEAACPEAVVIRNAANVGFARAVDQAIDAIEAPYGARILRMFRDVLANGQSDLERAAAVLALVRELGLRPAPAPEPLPVIADDDIHLVCWMALVPA